VFGLVARYVNLPLLHRLKAGMAKPKIAGKKDSVVHGADPKRLK
jgi:hypothetical protein